MLVLGMDLKVMVNPAHASDLAFDRKQVVPLKGSKSPMWVPVILNVHLKDCIINKINVYEMHNHNMQ